MLSRQSCFAGLGGMIADGMRRIEEGQHAIAHELVHDAAGIVNGALQHVEIAAQVADQVARRHAFGHPGEADYVRNQNGQRA